MQKAVTHDCNPGDRMNPCALLIMMISVAAPQGAALPQDWTIIKPNVTTVAELTKVFGPPDEVVASFPWSEWSAVWKKRPVTDRYTLRYIAQASRSALLDGPAGKADSVDVVISAKRVLAVEWEYGGPSARLAATRIRGDAGMQHDTVGSLMRAAKDVPGGWLLAELSPGDSNVRVELQRK